MFDKFKDECGVFGIFGDLEAANMTYLGLYALQHRGQESAGIAAADGRQVRISRAMGYVADTFDGQTLSTRVDASSDSSRVGGDQVRHVRFENGLMVLAPPRRLYAGVMQHQELAWERIGP